MVQTGKTAFTPGFKFEEATNQSAPKTVRAIAPAELKMVNYIDGEGREQNRLVAVVMGKKGGVAGCFVYNEKIQGQWVATEAYPWMVEGVRRLLSENEGDGGIDSV